VHVLEECNCQPHINLFIHGGNNPSKTLCLCAERLNFAISQVFRKTG